MFSCRGVGCVDGRMGGVGWSGMGASAWGTPGVPGQQLEGGGMGAATRPAYGPRSLQRLQSTDQAADASEPHLEEHCWAIKLPVVAQLAGHGHPCRGEGHRNKEEAEHRPAAALDLLHAWRGWRKATSHGAADSLPLGLRAGRSGASAVCCLQAPRAGGWPPLALLLQATSGGYLRSLFAPLSMPALFESEHVP